MRKTGNIQTDWLHFGTGINTFFTDRRELNKTINQAPPQWAPLYITDMKQHLFKTQSERRATFQVERYFEICSAQDDNMDGKDDQDHKALLELELNDLVEVRFIDEDETPTFYTYNLAEAWEYRKQHPDEDFICIL